MLRAHDISFKRIMTAGYISAETCNALLPKLYLKDLDQNEINSFSPARREELRRLFEDVNVVDRLYYIEQLDKMIIQEPTKIYSLLEEFIDQADYEYRNFIDDVGVKKYLEHFVFGFKTFGDYSKYTGYLEKSTIRVINATKSLEEKLKQYILNKNNEKYNTSDDIIILNSNVINKEDYVTNNEEIKWEGSDEVGNKIKNPLYLNSTYKTLDIKIDNEDEIVADNKELHVSEKESLDKSFSGKDIIKIEKDAVSSSNKDNLKYVHFLYSLDKEQLEPIIVFLEDLLKYSSIRTWNVIKALGYRDFLVNYLFAEPTKILRARNFGKKSLYDLEQIHSSIVDYIKDIYNNAGIEDSSIQQEGVLEKKTLKEKIGQKFYDVVVLQLDKILNKASVRTRNGIKNYGEDFIEDYVNKDGNIYNIKNIGRRSEAEVLFIISELKKFVNTLNNKTLSDKDLIILKSQAFYGDYFDEYAQSFYCENNHLPMLYMLNRFCKNQKIVNRQFIIFNSKTPIFIGEDSMSLEDIANHLYLTRERVRQIHMKYRKYLCELSENEDESLEEERITMSHFFANKNDWDYIVEQVKVNYYIDNTTLNEFTSLEKHNFTPQFILYIIEKVCSDFFVHIGAPILPYPTGSYNEWNNSYLVRKDLVEKFDFSNFIEQIKEYEKTNTENIELTAREMVIDTFLSAWIDYDSSIVEEVSDVVSNILIQELGIIPDENFRFTIEGKRKEDAADIMYDTLKFNGNPLSLDDLYQIVDNKYPNKYKSSTSIKSIVLRDHRLCLVGTNNLVALLEWDHVKIGSIRNIIVEFLEKYDKPQRVKDIVSYVQKYRETSDNSIRSTLGSGEQFVQFDGGYYGLKWKSYPDTFYVENDKKKKKSSWFENCKQYYDFVQNKHRRPSKYISTERDLFLWFQKATKDFTNSTLTQKQEISYLYLCKSL